MISDSLLRRPSQRRSRGEVRHNCVPQQGILLRSKLGVKNGYSKHDRIFLTITSAVNQSINQKRKMTGAMWEASKT